MKPNLRLIAGRPVGGMQTDNAGAEREEIHYLGNPWSWLEGVYLACGIGLLLAFVLFTLHLF